MRRSCSFGEKVPDLLLAHAGHGGLLHCVLRTAKLLRPEKPAWWCLIAGGGTMAPAPCAGRDRGHHVPHDRRWAVTLGVVTSAGAAAAAGRAGPGGRAAG